MEHKNKSEHPHRVFHEQASTKPSTSFTITGDQKPIEPLA